MTNLLSLVQCFIARQDDIKLALLQSLLLEIYYIVTLRLVIGGVQRYFVHHVLV